MMDMKLTFVVMVSIQTLHALKCDSSKFEFYNEQSPVCLPCDKCIAGEGRDRTEIVNNRSPKFGAKVCPECRPCKEGFFNDYEALECKPCRKCDEKDSYERQKCTRFTNAKCTKRKPKTTGVPRVTTPTVMSPPLMEEVVDPNQADQKLREDKHRSGDNEHSNTITTVLIIVGVFIILVSVFGACIVLWKKIIKPEYSVRQSPTVTSSLDTTSVDIEQGHHLNNKETNRHQDNTPLLVDEQTNVIEQGHPLNNKETNRHQDNTPLLVDEQTNVKKICKINEIQNAKGGVETNQNNQFASLETENEETSVKQILDDWLTIDKEQNMLKKNDINNTNTPALAKGQRLPQSYPYENNSGTDVKDRTSLKGFVIFEQDVEEDAVGLTSQIPTDDAPLLGKKTLRRHSSFPMDARQFGQFTSSRKHSCSSYSNEGIQEEGQSSEDEKAPSRDNVDQTCSNAWGKSLDPKGKPFVSELSHISKMLVENGDYKEFARTEGLRGYDIDGIVQSNISERERSFKVLEKIMQLKGREATRDSIKQALTKIKRNDIIASWDLTRFKPDLDT